MWNHLKPNDFEKRAPEVQNTNSFLGFGTRCCIQEHCNTLMMCWEAYLNGQEYVWRKYGSGKLQSGRGINEFFWEAVEGWIFGLKGNNLTPLSFNCQLTESSEHPACCYATSKHKRWRVSLGQKFPFHEEIFKMFATWLLTNNQHKHCRLFLLRNSWFT